MSFEPEPNGRKPQRTSDPFTYLKPDKLHAGGPMNLADLNLEKSTPLNSAKKKAVNPEGKQVRRMESDTLDQEMSRDRTIKCWKWKDALMQGAE